MDELQKKALLIGPCYKTLPRNQWLTCTHKDIEAVKNVLIQTFGFKEENIMVLEDDEATKVNILKVFSSFTCENGSVVFLYYSGHGVYLQDSQDEGLLPTISKWPIEGPKERVCITGKDLIPFLDKLSRKRVRCTMILDCCHSGQLYRVTEFEETNLKPRQVVLSRDSAEPQPSLLPRRYTKADRGGWAPDDKDCFFYFAACTTVQVALEEMYRGGRMTMAVVDVLKKLTSPDKVTYEAFFRLLKKHFKEKGWDSLQTPQFEAVNSHTVLFGISKVQEHKEGIEIIDVPNKDEVILDSGFLQNLQAGKYNVFETTASKADVMQGIGSQHWLGVIDVDEGRIDTTHSSGSISYLQNDSEITVGCLAYLSELETVNNSVCVCPEPGSVAEDATQFLVDYLKSTMMLNVSRNKPRVFDADLINITCEQIISRPTWIARRRGKILVPPITVGAGESIMANNLCRYIRYHAVIDMAKPPEDDNDLLENVSFRVLKVPNVEAYTKRTKQDRITKGLENGTDVTHVIDHRTIFKGHDHVNNKITFGTGDSFLFQVRNENDRRDDTIHICVMFYQFDGAIKAVYPKKRGKTIELRGGDTIEDLCPVYIPKHSLRSMIQPDLNLDEPNIGVDTLVLYASDKAVNYGPIEQTCIQTDPDILPRRGEPWSPLSGLDSFLALRKRPIPDNELEHDIKYFIQKIEIPVMK